MLKYEVYINGNELKGKFENLKDATTFAKRWARSGKNYVEIWRDEKLLKYWN